MLESLESRTLLSVTLEDGLLTVTGTEQADHLFIARNPTTNQFVVNDNGTPTAFNPADVTAVRLIGLGENDRIGVGPGVNRPIDIIGGEGDDYLTGGPGHERILGNAGNDRIAGGGGGDLLDGGANDDFIVGGPGPDHMLGGPGSDHFDAVDHFADSIDGGEDEDFARISRGDRALNVEHVFVVPPHQPSGVFADQLDDSGDTIDLAEQMIDEIA
jgi:Ca2+-binding RTX toxin-like protein